MMEYGFGIDIGGTTVKIAFFDCKGILLNKWEIKTNTANGGNAILPDIAASVKNYLIERNIPAEQIIGIGVGVPGPVDDNGIVNKCVNLGWGKVDLQKEETEACGCGKYGCAEQYCSAAGVVRVANRFLTESADASVLRMLEKMECKDVFEAAEKGDAAAQVILERVYSYLGLFLANICCVTDPDVILLGGGVSKASKPLVDGAMKYFQKYAFHACRETKILLAELGNDAGAYGAWKLALDAFGEGC